MRSKQHFQNPKGKNIRQAFAKKTVSKRSKCLLRHANDFSGQKEEDSTGSCILILQ